MEKIIKPKKDKKKKKTLKIKTNLRAGSLNSMLKDLGA